jgi:hypothetical protein
LQLFGLIVIESAIHPKARTQWRANHAGAGGGTDKGEFGEVEADAAGAGALINQDIQREVFHGWIKVFFDGWLQAMDFVDEKDASTLDVGQQTGKVPGLFNHWTAGAFNFTPHGISKDVSEGGFTQPWRTGKQDVLEDITALAGGFDHELEAFDRFGLSFEFGKERRPEGGFKIGA